MYRKHFPILIVMFAAALGCAYIPGFREIVRDLDDRRTESAKRMVAEDSRYIELNKVCAELPPPEGTNLVGKSLANHGIAISDYFFLDVSRAYILSHYDKQASEHGWERKNSREWMGHENHDYTKSNYRIALQLGGIGPNSNFATWCEDTATMKKPS